MVVAEQHTADFHSCAGLLVLLLIAHWFLLACENTNQARSWLCVMYVVHQLTVI